MNLDLARKKVKELSAKLFQKNKHEKVLKDYLALEKTRPDDLRLKVKIAETYFKIRDIPQAIATYEAIAQNYVEQNFLLKAIHMYKNVLKLDPLLIDINLKLAELYLKLDMKPEATNQYRIAMQHFLTTQNKEKLLEISQKLVIINPTTSNRRKFAEICQTNGLVKEAIEQYEILAKIFKDEKKYDDLLRVYELILPHSQNNKPILKDICVLYLRRKEPDPPIRLMERYKVDSEPEFAQLYDKARLMKKMLRSGAAKK